MEIYLDETGSLQESDPTNFFGFFGIVMNKSTRIKLFKSYKYVELLHSFPKELKLNSDYRQEYIDWLYKELCSFKPRDLTFGVYLDENIGKSQTKIIKEHVNNHFISAPAFLNSKLFKISKDKNGEVDELALGYSAYLSLTTIQTIIAALRNKIFARKIDEMSIFCDKPNKRERQMSLEWLQDDYNLFRKELENFYKVELPTKINLTFLDSADNSINAFYIQLVHNFAYLYRRDHLLGKYKKFIFDDRAILKIIKERRNKAASN